MKAAKKRITVCTRFLPLVEGWLGDMVHVSQIQEMFDLPDAIEGVWIELSNGQFPERDGVRSRAKFVPSGIACPYLEFGSVEAQKSIDPLLRKLGVNFDRPTAVWMRVWHE